MNQTKTHVPKIAVAKAKRARLHKLEAGINNSVSRTMVDRCDLIKSTPFFSRLVITNQIVK